MLGDRARPTESNPVEKSETWRSRKRAFGQGWATTCKVTTEQFIIMANIEHETSKPRAT